jgi:hypothetical protein
MPAGGGDPYKEFKIEQAAIEKEVWTVANFRQKAREKRIDLAKEKGLPTPPPTEYSLSEYSLVTDHSQNQNGPRYLLSGVNPYWKKPVRSSSDTALTGGAGTIVRKGPDAAVKIMPSLCGTLQHAKYQNNLSYVDSLKEGKANLEALLADPQAPTRTVDGRDPFRSEADQATNYLPRYRDPPEDVSKVGVWRMKTVLGKTIWYLDVPQEEKDRQAMNFQDSLKAFQDEFSYSGKDAKRSKAIRRRSRTYEPRNPNTGGWYTTLLGSC